MFANFFRLSVDKSGDVFDIGPEINETIDRSKTIRRNGHFYSYESDYGELCDYTSSMILGFIRKTFTQKAKAKKYLSRGRYTLYKNEDEIHHDNEDIYQLFRGFKHRIMQLENDYYLCIDPACVLLSVASIEYLEYKGISPHNLEGFSVRHYTDDGHRISGYLLKTEKELDSLSSTIRFYRKPFGVDLPDVAKLPSDQLYPEPRPELLESFLQKIGTPSSIIRMIRRLSFLSSRTPSRDRLVETIRLSKKLDNELFPFEFGGFKISLDTEPIIVKM